MHAGANRATESATHVSSESQDRRVSARHGAVQFDTMTGATSFPAPRPTTTVAGMGHDLDATREGASTFYVSKLDTPSCRGFPISRTLGVIEEGVPDHVAVLLRFHPPAQLRSSPSLRSRNQRAHPQRFNFLGEQDYIALWTDHPIRQPYFRMPTCGRFNQAVPQAQDYTNTTRYAQNAT